MGLLNQIPSGGFRYSLHSGGVAHHLHVDFFLFGQDRWAEFDAVGSDIQSLEHRVYIEMRLHFLYLLWEFHGICKDCGVKTFPKFTEMLWEFQNGDHSHLQMIDRLKPSLGLFKLFLPQDNPHAKLKAQAVSKLIFEFMDNHKYVKFD